MDVINYNNFLDVEFKINIFTIIRNIEDKDVKKKIYIFTCRL